MPLSNILALWQDFPAFTPQEIANQALIADQEARRLAREGDPRAEDARREADAIADQIHRKE